MKVKYTSQADIINTIISSKHTPRVGKTDIPNTRAGQYTRNGYSGSTTTMLVAPTTNARQSEQRLLDTHFKYSNNRINDNVQKISNTQSSNSYVYAIVGNKKN